MKTKINLNAPGSPSLRTTIPLALAEVLDLKPGDMVEWSLEFREGKHVLVIERDEKMSAFIRADGKHPAPRK